ncbi:hypothetical protein [Noviluteimonas dokdonensis]|uniref:hypothetical protein n=1 Tax=Noviluteimonas dokdonensis TaxID=414050 RepID=UPI000689D5DF|nr:hypothetical protein [Lysobacter dokdonensis]
MTWLAAFRLIGIRGLLAIAFALSTLTFYAMWKHQVERNWQILSQYTKAQADAQIAARQAEARKAQELAAIADKYEQDKRAADEAQRKLVADLRAGSVRLQERWAGCVSDVAATAAERDAAARDREESAARIVRAARDADDQIRALQEIVRKDRQP